MRKRPFLSPTFAALAGLWTLAVVSTPAQDAFPLAPTAEEQAAPAERKPATLTILQLLQKGGPLMYPLYLCSIATVAFGIERGIALRRRRVLPPILMARVRAVLDESVTTLDTGRLQDELRAKDCPISRILDAGLRKVNRPLAEVEKAIGYAGEKESAAMRRNCRVLSITASISPLLGLLGTIFGMIQAFMTVAAQEEALGRTELLAAGIYQALVTTAVGLSIAIPALVLYHIFVEKVNTLVSEMDDLATEIVERLAPGA